MARRRTLRRPTRDARGLRPQLVVAPSPGRLVFLPPDWLPVALIGGDALIVLGSILAAVKRVDSVYDAARVLPANKS